MNPEEANQNKVRFNRVFDTCDEKDFPFHEGTINLHFVQGKKFIDAASGFPLDLADSDVILRTNRLQLLKANEPRIPEE